MSLVLLLSRLVRGVIAPEGTPPSNALITDSGDYLIADTGEYLEWS